MEQSDIPQLNDLDQEDRRHPRLLQLLQSRQTDAHTRVLVDTENSRQINDN